MCKISGKKQINQNWLNQLNEIALAYWFMDDGSYPKSKKKRRVNLHTEGFSFKENEILQSRLQDFGCRPQIKHRVKKNKKYYYLTFRVYEGKRFLELVKPYVYGTGMEYKIN